MNRPTQVSGEGMPAGLAVEAAHASGSFDPSPENVPLHEHSNVVAFARRVQVRIVLQNPDEILEAPRFQLQGDDILDGFWILTNRTRELGTFYPYQRFVSMQSFDPNEEDR
jgi:hypothetical protein